MLTAYATVLAFLLVAWLLVLVSMVAWKLAGPRAPRGSHAGEPGADSDEGTAVTGSTNFNPRFFVVALVALVFDAAVALVYPAAAVFRRLVADGHGKRALVEVLVVVAVLLLGLAYAWKKGDLDPA
jgi:NADH-quinone oxidoreductase subunit A